MRKLHFYDLQKPQSFEHLCSLLSKLQLFFASQPVPPLSESFPSQNAYLITYKKTEEYELSPFEICHPNSDAIKMQNERNYLFNKLRWAQTHFAILYKKQVPFFPKMKKKRRNRLH